MILAGVDIGGTFTDIVLTDTSSKRSYVHKVPTTSDPSQGMVKGLLELSAQIDLDTSRVRHIFHGTTIATNAVLTYEGAKTGMITTDGYRDVIHIARHQRPQHYSIMQEVPWQDRPLVRRRHRKVVPERITPPKGTVEQPLDQEAAIRAIRELKAAGVESISVCFLFSYLNPEHEERVRAMIEEEFPEAFVSTSASIFPQFREFERFTTAAINAFVGPKVRRYIDHLQTSIGEARMDADLHLMRSNGGVATARAAAEQPVTLLFSGPAAGVLGGDWIGRLAGRRKLITFDVGGTSADIGIVTERGFVEASARDTQIAGYPVMVPMIDIETIGAGGGSVAYVDSGGAFRVGPRSAGAHPGPACYGRGGEEPTVTDANLVLGRLDPEHFLGGQMTIHRKRAEEAIDGVAARLGLSREEAAEGVVTIVDSNMANAIRGVTIRKGHDPREFTLVAFGGAGPLHAADVAESLEIPEVLVPPHPGITSAMGLLTTDLKYDGIRTQFMLSSELDTGKLNADFGVLEQSIREQLGADGVPKNKIKLTRSADCRYVGQGYELRVPVPDGELDQARMDRVWSAFHNLHATEYGHSFRDSPIELVAVRLVGMGLMPKISPIQNPGVRGEPVLGTRDVYFRVGGELRTFPTMCYERSRLRANARIEGPAVIFQVDSTTVVPPGWSLHHEASGSLLLVNSNSRSKKARKRRSADGSQRT
jgi:N-methylhydantoinase A/oxoprolinase/acetone carboxylase beta subunit